MKRGLSSLLYKAVIAAMLAVTGGVIAAVAMLLFDSQPSATPEQPDTTAATTVTTAAASKQHTPMVNPLKIDLLENGYYFDQLEEPLRVQYNSILTQILMNADEETYTDDGEYGESISLFGYAHDDESISELLLAVHHDHPELFFVTTRYSYRYLEKGLFVDVYYSMSAEERTAAVPLLEQTIDELLEQCTAEEEYDTELQLHDALLEQCSYNDEAADLDNIDDLHWDMSSPYAALCDGEAICGGYARAMQWLLMRADIDATLVYNENHVWNLVWIDGQAYYLDPTWNDFDDAFVSHMYFNVTDKELAATRELTETAVVFPAATATAANYHRRSGYYVDGHAPLTLSAVIQAQVLDGGERVELRVSEELFDETIAYIESDAFFDEFDCLSGTPYEEQWYSFRYYHEEKLGALEIICTGNE